MEPINDGCFDCGGGQDELLTSVTTTREIKIGRDKGKKQTGSFALCSECVKAEAKNLK